MTRYWKIVLCAAMLAFSVMASAQQSKSEPLGDVARQERAKPKPQAMHVWTNDEIPSVTIDEKSVDTASKEPSADAKSSTTSEAANNESADTPKDAWKNKIAEAKTKVSDLEREINLMEREYRLRAAVFYADAGAQLRDSRKWGEEEKKYNDDLAAKKSDLASARQKLDDLREQARKAGAGSIE